MSDLLAILQGVDWKKNVGDNFADAKAVASLDSALLRIAVWSKQLEQTDKGNPALCFARESQAAAQQSVALIGLSMYKASAASVRTCIETCLYYTFFRTHMEELSSLLREKGYYLSKKEIIEYHKIHTAGFAKSQATLGFIGDLEAWYSKVSAIVHGQIPGAWNNYTMLADISFDKANRTLAVSEFLKGEELMHRLLLCTAGRRLWPHFASDAKSFLVKGMPGEKRVALGLDKA